MKICKINFYCQIVWYFCLNFQGRNTENCLKELNDHSVENSKCYAPNLTPFQEAHYKSCRQLLMTEDITIRLSHSVVTLFFYYTVNVN
jgi:hypothetical protein